MAHISTYVDAPYQGVSQAPAQVRLDTQAEALEDVLVAIPTGAAKRPPFAWGATLVGPAGDDAAEAYIPAVPGPHLLLVTSESAVTRPRLYSLGSLPDTASSRSAVAVTISPAAQAYLNQGSPVPSTDLAILTVEDYTFILNKKVTVGLLGTTAPTRPKEAMLWVRQAAYSRTYEVKVTYGATTTTVSLTTPNGKDATDAVDVDTDVIAGGLYGSTYPTGSTSATNGAVRTGSLSSLTGAGFTVTLQGGVIYLSHPTQDFALEVKDGQGGNALIAVKDKVQAFSDLPKKAPVNGFTIRITQQTGSDQDDFWVQWQETAGKGTGIWQETIAPGAPLGFDPATLPVGLVYDRGTSSWSIDVLDWTGRTVGDATLAPDPGFVGETLQDITFWRGRLVLVYSGGARASSSTDPLRLYISTLSQALADDAFEVINPLESKADFRHAVAFKRVLILWGTRGQAQVHTNGQPLTEATCAIEPFAGYEVSPLVRPQGSNDRIYFAAPRGKEATAVYEIEVPSSSGSEAAAEGDDMSVSVPRFIPADINHVATCPVNYMSVYGKTGDTELTVHLYRYADRKRAQNAWARWALPLGATYVGGFFVNTTFYCLVYRGGVVHLLLLDTADGAVDPGREYLIHADYKVDTSMAVVGRTYNSTLDLTTVTVPFALQREPVCVIGPSGGAAGVEIGGELPQVVAGEVIPVASWSAGSPSFSLAGDWTGVEFTIGEVQTGRWVLSPLLYRDTSGRPNRTGNLKIGKITFDLDRTALVKARVTIGGRSPFEYQFESPLLDAPSLDYDQVNLYSGEWAVPVGGKASEVTVEVLFDSWAPASIVGFTWEGEVNTKSFRVAGS